MWLVHNLHNSAEFGYIMPHCLYSRTPVSTDSVSVVDRGPKQKLKIIEINGS
jgi:hypothetical protein